MKNIFYILSILALFFTACNEGYQEIEWELDEQPSRLIVEGEITNFRANHKIRLAESDTYFSNKALKGVSNAEVIVTDGQNSYSFLEDSVFKGVYTSEVRFSGVVGRTYTLNIELESAINGETSYSASCTMNEGIRIDNSFSYIYENPIKDFGEGDSTILYAYVFGQEPREIGNYYVVNLYKNSELLNDTIDEQTVVYDEESGINGEYNLSFFFFEQFLNTDRVTIEIKSVDKGYYEFIDGLQQVAQGYDPLGFSGPPANPVGNIEGGDAFGYFLVSYVSRHSSYPEYAVEN